MPSTNNLVYQGALRDFQDARRRAVIQDLKARLTGAPDNLLSYDEVATLLHAEGATRRGLHDIPSVEDEPGQFSLCSGDDGGATRLPGQPECLV